MKDVDAKDQKARKAWQEVDAIAVRYGAA